MDCLCYTIVIRQRMCQSGVPVERENTFTNLGNNETISLLNGYFVTISTSTNNAVRVAITNPAFNLSLAFIIQDNSYGIFDLPIQGGTFRVGIYIKTLCCCR